MEYMEKDMKMRVLYNSLPYEMNKQENGQVRVKWRNSATKEETEEGIVIAFNILIF